MINIINIPGIFWFVPFDTALDSARHDRNHVVFSYLRRTWTELNLLAVAVKRTSKIKGIGYSIFYKLQSVLSLQVKPVEENPDNVERRTT